MHRPVALAVGSHAPPARALGAERSSTDQLPCLHVQPELLQIRLGQLSLDQLGRHAEALGLEVILHRGRHLRDSELRERRPPCVRRAALSVRGERARTPSELSQSPSEAGAEPLRAQAQDGVTGPNTPTGPNSPACRVGLWQGPGRAWHGERLATLREVMLFGRNGRVEGRHDGLLRRRLNPELF